MYQSRVWIIINVKIVVHGMDLLARRLLHRAISASRHSYVARHQIGVGELAIRVANNLLTHSGSPCFARAQGAKQLSTRCTAGFRSSKVHFDESTFVARLAFCI